MGMMPNLRLWIVWQAILKIINHIGVLSAKVLLKQHQRNGIEENANLAIVRV
jgi:hypothetical protein